MGTTANRHPRTGLRLLTALLVLLVVMANQGQAWAHHRPDHHQGPPGDDPTEEPTEEPTQEPTDPDPANSDITFDVWHSGYSCGFGLPCEVSWSCDLTVATGARELEILEAARRSGCIDSYVVVPYPWTDGWLVECINDLCAGASIWNCLFFVPLVCVPYPLPNFYDWSAGTYQPPAEDGQVVRLSCACRVW